MGARSRTISILMAVQAVGALLVVLLGERTLRAVTVTLPGQPTSTLSHVDLGAAMVVVLALSAAAWALSAGAGARSSGAGARSSWWSGALDPLLTTPITLFVVAQLNGIRDVGALVGVYALASAGVLFAVVQRRDDRATGGSRVPLGLGSAVGIVPWGIVAFHQVGAGIVGHPLPGIVVVITLTALVAAVAEFVATWRRQLVAAAVLRTAGFALVAWLVVAAL
ncbi:hypothetical protein BIU98_10590 [Curtobacterium sp. MMLR14_010]|uniref:hypothetical protein n=1 Tax=Curtobacterium sp. MMLR14_010 TaxID=1898743 RepID=UPI0008DC8B90|nr:hypothetical protein [Curtobacterium sp. MMLR14_010]OII39520.1 hypothetical protein BIU98_10590 [Curtobacterium sp. MMLR14_010]